MLVKPPKLNEEEALKTVGAMEEYGGSFVQALALCFRRADFINSQKLVNAFPEYFEQYKRMAQTK